MKTTDQPPASWRIAVREKLASSTRDDEAIAEAFAQQAYTAVANRDKAIMKDPHLLGFEIVEKNEDNSRLIGVFAFRVGDEILLVPVFYLNGTTKGQVLLYRKGANRFCPNTEKWVAYLLGKGEEREGRGMPRGALRDARISLHADRAVRAPGYGGMRGKFASAAIPKGISPQLLIALSEGYSMPPSSITSDMPLIREQSAQTPKLSDNDRLRSVLDGILEGRLESTYPEDQVAGLKTPADVQAALFADRDEEPSEADLSRLGELEGVFGKKKASGPVDINALWKEACAWAVSFVEPTPVMADFLAAHGLGKAAADLVGRVPALGDLIEEAGGAASAGSVERERMKEAAAYDEGKPVSGLNPYIRIAEQFGCTAMEAASIIGKEAAAPDTLPAVTLFHEPPTGKSEEQIQEFYKRGFLIEDARDAEDLTKLIRKGEVEQRVTTLTKPGVRVAESVESGDGTKVLWGPVIQRSDDNTSITPVGAGDNEKWLVVLEGKDKGRRLVYGNWEGDGQMPVFREGKPDETGEDLLGPEGTTDPAKGKTYAVWVRSLGGFFPRPVHVVSKLTDKSEGNRILINTGVTDFVPQLVICKDIEVSDEEGILQMRYNRPVVLGADAVFIEMEAEISRDSLGNKRVHGVEVLTPTKFSPLTISSLKQTFLKRAHTIDLGHDDHGFSLSLNGREKLRYQSAKKMACHLVCDVRLSPADALEALDAAEADGKAAFHILPPGTHELNMIEAMLGCTVKEAGLKDMGAAMSPEMAAASDKREQTSEGTPGPVDKAKGFGSAATEKVQGLLSNPKVQESLKNPWVLGALGLGAAGTGAMAYRAMRRKKTPKDGEPEKEASSIYYERDIDPRSEFMIDDMDEDLGIPMDMGGHSAQIMAVRQKAPGPERRYLDALGYGGPRNAAAKVDHIPDEVIMGMLNPAREMTEIGRQLGLNTLLDHGAIGTMARVFDASPYILEYVSKLEGSLDYLARLLFMLWWKPKDFNDMFGDDDVINMENKLSSVFDAYGDLVLELLQRTDES